MHFDDTNSGDHLETQADKPAVVANIPERQGVTGHHNVRFVLWFGIAGVVIAFAIILVSYIH